MILTFVIGAVVGAILTFFVVRNNQKAADKIGDTIDNIKDDITGEK